MATSDDREAAFRAAYDAMLRLWTTPPIGRTVRTPLGETHLQTWGDPSAPPLVLLHGFKVTSTMWAPQAAALGAARSVFAPDTLGDYGWSRPARRLRGLPDLLLWLDELVDGLGLGELDIGGMSYGGWLAAHWAARRPERVRRLVLLAPGASFGRFTPAWYLRGIPMLVSKQRRHVDAYLRWAGVPDGGPRYEAWMNALVDVMHAGHRHFPIFGLPVPALLPDATLARLRAPTLLVLGEAEKQYAAAPALARARAKLPQLQAVLVPEASHDLTLRQPERVNQELLRFLSPGAA